jgi:hypothetical protein
MSIAHTKTGPNNFIISPTSSGHFKNLFGGIYNIIVRKEGVSDCHKSISITITEPSSPLEIITDSLRNESCNGSDGEILIRTTGGNDDFYKRYEWEALNSSSVWGPVPVMNGGGTNYLTGLTEGKYRVKVTEYESSTNSVMSCSTKEEFEIKAHSLEFKSLVFDENYCDGASGIIEAEIKSSNNDLSFYYDGVIIQNSNVELISTNDSTKLYQIKIIEPKLDRDVTVEVIDAYGCTIDEKILFNDLSIVEPSFDIFDENGKQYVTKFRKDSEITFQMGSSSNYEYVEWDFGDGSEILRVNKNNFSNVIKYFYNWEGKYQVTLKAYNKGGCYKSYSIEITIGKGYEILMPSVFTPNNDNINDIIKPLFVGLKNVEFSIFDQTGVMLHNEVVDISTGEVLIGWDGKNSDSNSTTFIYRIVATLLDDEVVTDMGTFILLNR